MFRRYRELLSFRFAFTALVFGLVPSDYVFARETPRVLPAGIRRVRVVGVMTGSVNDTFNESGDLQGLSYSLNRSVSVNDIRASSDTATQAQLDTLISSLNTVQAGLGDQFATSSANLYSDFNLRQTIYLGAFEYGLTERLALGIRAPVVRRNAHITFHATPSASAAAVAAIVGQNLSPPVAAGIGKIASLNTAAFEQSLFTNKGYQAPRDYDETQLGDVEFGGKYNFYRGEIIYSSFLLGMSVPTGAKSDLRNPFNQGNSKETWCVALQFLQDIYPTRSLTLSGSAKLAASFQDTRDRAVPRNASDSLPSLLPSAGQVQQVTRQRGQQLETELSAGYKFPSESVEIWSAFQYSQKGKDKFSGPGKLYYDGLVKNTDWRLAAGELGLGYSTIPAFRARRFSLPMEVTLLYNKPLNGRNTPLAAYARMDLMLYF